MKRILLINFGRMGDLIQSSPLISCLREQNPGVEIGYIAASGFAGVMRGIPGIDIHHPIELFKYMAPLKEGNLLGNLRLFKGLLDKLKSYDYDVIFNLTHNRLGAVLSGLLPGEVVGLTIDERGFSSVNSRWMRQFYNTNINRGLNQFNLVDLYRLAAGFKREGATDNNSRLRFMVDEETRGWAEDELKKRGWKPGRKIIGFQAGASMEAKRWDVINFNRTAKALAGDFSAAFFGTEVEKGLVGEAVDGVPGAMNFAGETDIGQLAALLEKCELLVTNDTGTQHLAAAVGKPIISLTMGSALASETGPFGEGHIIVEPDIDCMPCSYKYPCLDFACHSLITPELVEWTVREMIENGGIDGVPDLFGSRAKVSVTVFDDEGLWYLEPIVPASDTFRERVNIAYRKAWFELLNSNDNNDISINITCGKEIADVLITTLEQIDELIEYSGRGKRLAWKLCSLSEANQSEVEIIKEAGGEIAEVDLAIESLGNTNRELRPLTLDFHLGKEALPDAGLKRLAELTVKLYRNLSRGGRLFKKYLIEAEGFEARTASAPAIPSQRAFEKVLAVDTPYFVSGEIIRAMKRRGIAVELVELDIGLQNAPGGAEEFINRLLAKVQSFKPDSVFTVNHLGFDEEGFVLGELAKLGVRSAVYYVDSPLLIMNHPQKLVDDSSWVFCWDEYYIGKLKDYGFQKVEYLPLAADIGHFYPRSSAQIPPEYRSRILFAADSLAAGIEKCGRTLTDWMLSGDILDRINDLWSSNGKVLPEVLEQVSSSMDFSSLGQRRNFRALWTLKKYQAERLKILRELAELGLTIRGDSGWEAYFGDGLVELKGIVSYFEQLPLAYSGAEIGFNCTSLQMPYGVNQRVFDIPACGGFLLTDYRPALEEIFDIKKDIAVYHSAEEARELAEYYLKRPAERRKMSERARVKIIETHTYKHRVDAIFEKMSFSSQIHFRSRAAGGVMLATTVGDTISINEGVPLELEVLKAEFPQKLDVPEEISVLHFGERSLVIAPQRAAWIVTDKIGASLVEEMSGGAAMGEAAAKIAVQCEISSETALRKLREVVEKMNLANFRENLETGFVDIDSNPRNLQLFLTRKCNLHCGHCYFSAGEAMPEEIPTDDWKGIIRKFAFMGQGNVLTFTGGEPLMHPDFYEIAQEAVEQGLTVYLLTNGGLIRDKTAAKGLASVVDVVQVSIDGTTAEINDKIRSPGSFLGAVNAIRLLLAEKVEVEITTVVMPENADDLVDNLADFVASFDSSRLRSTISVANPIGRLNGHNLEAEESLVGRVLSKHGDAPWLRTGRFNLGNVNFGCELATSIVINPEGKIGNCPYLNYSGPRNIKEGDFAKLAAEDRLWHRNKIKSSRKCQSCDLRNFQCGGCKIYGKCTEQLKLRNYYRLLESK